MGNSSVTNALKDRAVIAAIVEEKNKWHDTVSGTKYPDMSLINDMLFNTLLLQRYVQQTPAMVNQASSHRDSNFSLGTDRMSDEVNYAKYYFGRYVDVHVLVWLTCYLKYF